MERAAGRLQLLPTTSQIDRVVGVAAIGRATTGRHEPAVTELTQVVRHQALRLGDQPGQLPHGPIAPDQFLQQLPPHGV